MNRRGQRTQKTSGERRREAIANEYLDAVVEGRTDDAKRLLESSGEPQLVREQVKALRDVILELRTPIDTPDLSASILRKMHEQRPFVEAPLRRRISRSRVMMVAAALTLCASAALLHRITPEQPSLSPEAETNLWATPSNGASARFDAAPDDTGPQLGEEPQASTTRLSLGDTTRFERTSPVNGFVGWVSAGSGAAFPTYRTPEWNAGPMDMALFPMQRPSLLRASPTTASYRQRKWSIGPDILPPTEVDVRDESTEIRPDADDESRSGQGPTTRTPRETERPDW